MSDPELILASASPARTKLLADAGIAHRVMVSDVDEDAVTAAAAVTDPHEMALLLARAKCEAVAANYSGSGLVLGCDSVFEFDGAAYGKPYTEAAARERILQMRGKSGVLHTGHWLIDSRQSAAGAVASATVHFADMTNQEVDAYVATSEPLNVAGSFTIDSYGAAFITSVDGDAHAIVGLSVSTLRSLLARVGVSITDLWQAPAS
ncbi:Maf family protein [Arthrobacter castelli]|uniref:Maf family protein n=1 Tax=Arthrobacter castelli TaxID=271431 RepID=UPI00041947AA|nr:Maf family protein [Arthrobacter castelli]